MGVCSDPEESVLKGGDQKPQVLWASHLLQIIEGLLAQLLLKITTQGRHLDTVRNYLGTPEKPRSTAAQLVSVIKT